jgi:hypothetical protein
VKNIGGIKMMGGKPNYMEKNPFFCHLTTTNPTQNGLGLNMGFGGDKLATNNSHITNPSMVN